MLSVSGLVFLGRAGVTEITSHRQKGKAREREGEGRGPLSPATVSRRKSTLASCPQTTGSWPGAGSLLTHSHACFLGPRQGDSLGIQKRMCNYLFSLRHNQQGSSGGWRNTRPERSLFSRNILPTPFLFGYQTANSASGAAGGVELLALGGHTWVGNGFSAVGRFSDPDRVEPHPALTWGAPVLQGPEPCQVGSLGGRGWIWPLVL